MLERLKQLKFYFPNDTSAELFSAICILCYKMHGVGDEEKAELLFAWAKEMADATREELKNEFPEKLWQDDYITGINYV